jgi:hypothetical protein
MPKDELLGNDWHTSGGLLGTNYRSKASYQYRGVKGEQPSLFDDYYGKKNDADEGQQLVNEWKIRQWDELVRVWDSIRDLDLDESSEILYDFIREILSPKDDD